MAKQKKSQTINLYFVADRSGSMSSLAEEVIGGFNAYVEKQKEQPGNANLTYVQFDNEYQVVHKNVPIKDVPKLTKEVYWPRGMTSLYDAIGKTIAEGLISSDKGDLNILTIMTDGQENSSKEYQYQVVKDLIKRAQDEFGWEVIFMGANMDANQYAGNMGIKAKNIANFDASILGAQAAINTMSYATTAYRGFYSGTSTEVGMEVFAKSAATDATALNSVYQKINEDAEATKP